MTEISTNDGALATWSAPQCPFVIEYSRRALDDIRLAVVDAFFSPPRGGVEIGGILLGRFESERLQILDSIPIECEHAFGPVFTLSPADQVRLGEMLGRSYPGDLKAVGWYHSHTRSEIALCEADLDIHNRYFSERWQVALVLRPSTLQPTQAGFFFREPDGSIQIEHSYHEFVVEALPVQPVPQGVPVALPGPTREIESDAVVLTLASAQPEDHAVDKTPDGLVADATEPKRREIHEPVMEEMHELTPEEVHEPERAEMHEASRDEWHEPAPDEWHEPARMEMHESARPEWHEPERERIELPERERLEMPEPEEAPQRPWIGIAAGLAVGLVLGAIGNQMRSHSQPATPVVPAPAVAARPADAALRRRSEDLAKQVAALSQQNADLRQQNEQSGKQQADVPKLKSDLAKAQADLAKQQSDSSKAQAELRQQRDDLAKQTAKLKADVAAQTARAQSIQQQLDDLRRQQQRRRLTIQSADPLP